MSGTRAATARRAQAGLRLPRLGQLVRLQKGGSMSDVDPHPKAVCEDLTGVKYDSIEVWKKDDQPQNKSRG